MHQIVMAKLRLLSLERKRTSNGAEKNIANKTHRSLMEFREKLLKFKFHIIFAFVFSLLTVALVTYSPGFLIVLSYFWPLFLSTALFLAAVFFFARTSDLPTSSTISSDGSGVKLAAEGILDYVVGGQEEETLLDSFTKLD
ncbi:hypothetical protein HID58_044254 [Brassica napus]|uniref:Transmembrane protein n=2 Tax=Brassica napus TaxID=3708 RepID=A0ABQ8BIT5_BRANA|nr:hypothetical protein HID58_044254 [Brassica napus]